MPNRLLEIRANHDSNPLITFDFILIIGHPKLDWENYQVQSSTNQPTNH